MVETCYERLAAQLDRLPNGFPRTQSKIELTILEKIFSPEDAELLSHLQGTMESAEQIAERADLPIKKTQIRLLKFAKRRVALMGGTKSEPTFRLAPFIVGIYEAQVNTIDHELAHMVEEYMNNGGAEGLMEYGPAFQRVVPAHGSVNPEWILPYDDVKAMMMKSVSFFVNDCICRKKMKLLDKGCDFPLKNCLAFFAEEKPARPSSTTKEEALQILDEARDLGLVHTVSNIAKGVFYVCNCCGCCCELLLGIHKKGLKNSIAKANYLAVIDDAQCEECEICVERCQVNAIHSNGSIIVDQEKCIGCGVCVTGCPSEAISLQRIPDAEIIHPPEDFAAWEQLRLQNRKKAGLE